MGDDTLFDTHMPIVLRRTGLAHYRCKRWPHDFPGISAGSREFGSDTDLARPGNGHAAILKAYMDDFRIVIQLIAEFLDERGIEDIAADRVLGEMLGISGGTPPVRNAKQTSAVPKARGSKVGTQPPRMSRTAWGDTPALPTPASPTRALTRNTGARLGTRNTVRATRGAAGVGVTGAAAMHGGGFGGFGAWFGEFIGWTGRNTQVHPSDARLAPQPRIVWVENPYGYMETVVLRVPPNQARAEEIYQTHLLHEARLRERARLLHDAHLQERARLLHDARLQEQEQEQARLQSAVRCSDVDLARLVGEGGNGCVYLSSDSRVATKLFRPSAVKLFRKAYRLLSDRVVPSALAKFFVVPYCITNGVVHEGSIGTCRADHLTDLRKRADGGAYRTGLYKMPAAEPIVLYDGDWRRLLPAFSAVHSLQDGGLVHGDLKWENMLVDRGSVKLCDLDGLFDRGSCLDPNVNIQATSPTYFLTPPEFILNGVRNVRDAKAALKKTMTRRLKSVSVFHCVEYDPQWSKTRYMAYGWMSDKHVKAFVSSENRPSYNNVWSTWRPEDWPWDKFDVYGLGVALLEVALQSPPPFGSRASGLLDGLIADMIHWDPMRRVGIAEAAGRFAVICGLQA